VTVFNKRHIITAITYTVFCSDLPEIKGWVWLDIDFDVDVGVVLELTYL